MPALADQGLIIGSESSFYRLLHQASQCHRRGRARLPQELRSVPCLVENRANAVWSWDITYLPTAVRGVSLYLYLVVDVWSRKVVAWDVAEVESAEIGPIWCSEPASRSATDGPEALAATRASSHR
ncbi:DDE-type integrase/transposase/recombinase [Cyanobium sp. ULC084]